MRIVLSMRVVASRRPSGLNAQSVTLSACPLRDIWPPVWGSIIRTSPVRSACRPNLRLRTALIDSTRRLGFPNGDAGNCATDEFPVLTATVEQNDGAPAKFVQQDAVPTDVAIC
jgi:hypothetical protein